MVEINPMKCVSFSFNFKFLEQFQKCSPPLIFLKTFLECTEVAPVSQGSEAHAGLFHSRLRAGFRSWRIMRPALCVLWAVSAAVLLRKPAVRLARGAPVVSLSAGLSRVKRLAFDPTYVAPWIPAQDPEAVTFPPGWYFKDDAWGRVNASLNVTNYSGLHADYEPVGCHSQYSFATITLGDVSVETTVRSWLRFQLRFLAEQKSYSSCRLLFKFFSGVSGISDMV